MTAIVLACIGIVLIVLTWRERRAIQQGELQAWWDAGREAGYQAAISDALRLARESDDIKVDWETSC